MALWTVAVLAVTGLLRAVDELGTIGRLFSTSFGLALLVKTVLFAGVLVIAYVNRSRLVPAVERGGDAGALRRSVRGEVGLIAGVLVAAAVLSELPPAAYVAATAAPKARQVTASGSDFATTVRVRLTASPGTVGSNRFRVSVVDFDTGHPAAARSVQLQFSFPANPSVSSVLDLARGTGSTWSGRGTNLSIQGRWDIQVVVQEPATAVDVPLHLRTALPPERITTQAASGQPTLFTIQLGGGLTLQTYVDPGTKPGPNVVHFTFFQFAGGEEPIASAAASAITPSGADRGLRLIRFDKGHFASNATLTAGTWTFQISARTGDGKSLFGYFTQRIGS
jgi:nitrogen fixation protein FixH